MPKIKLKNIRGHNSFYIYKGGEIMKKIMRKFNKKCDLLCTA